MPAPALHNSHRFTFAFAIETAQGTTPADAAAWAAAEVADPKAAWRMKVTEADHAYIFGEVEVANVDMEANVFTRAKPHHGLPTADGGTIAQRLWSHGDSYTDDTQALGGVHSGLGELLKHALGGGALGHHTSVTTVTSQTEFVVDSAANLAAGYIINFEDADDPGRLFPAQVLTVSGTTITIDRQLPFTVAIGDKINGTEMAWPDAEHLTNPQDASYSTLSLLYQVGPHLWMAGGAHLELASMKIERGQQPSIGWGVSAAKGYPQGAGAPAAPTWTGTVEGAADVKAIGHDTKCFIQTRGITTHVSETLFAATFTPGVPVKPQDAVTEVDDGSPGRAAYVTEPADTIFELTVALTDAQQTRWVDGTEITLTYYQVAPVGRGWGIHIAKAFLMGPPKAVKDGTNRFAIRVQATHDDDATTEAKAAKFIIFRS